MNPITPLPEYPETHEVETWIESVWALSDSTECPATLLSEKGFSHNFGIRHTPGFQYVQFSPRGMSPFYGYWQPALSTPAPLLVHTPGYLAEMSAHPDLVASGFNVLHISPLGYSTPQGADESKQRDGSWPVLPDTVLSEGQCGYREWLANCLMAIRWALQQPEVLPDRLSFFGTSQGGGGALLLGSLHKDRGVRCVAADVPFLTDFRRAQGRGAYDKAAAALRQMDDPAKGWRALGLIDTLSHAPRLNIPVLLTAGSADTVCPPDTIEQLFAILPSTRSYTLLKDTGHGYTTFFIPLATAWFRLYA